MEAGVCAGGGGTVGVDTVQVLYTLSDARDCVRHQYMYVRANA
jgi:hypothetical protein